MARRSFWAWGLESQEPTPEQRQAMAGSLSRKYGVTVAVPPTPTAADLNLRQPRMMPPSALAAFCSTNTHDRAVHTYGRNFKDRVRAFNREFPNPTDVVAYPRNEQEVEAVLEWCSTSGYAAIPYGGGSSVVGGVEPPEGFDGVVTIDLSALSRVLEVDDVSRAARIQAGVYGPAHHHAVGRVHRPWYDQERPDPFAQALRAAKGALDPQGVLNPGVLIDP
jgi:alkyldihydroxyacetonephosphate synthase